MIASRKYVYKLQCDRDKNSDEREPGKGYKFL